MSTRNGQPNALPDESYAVVVLPVVRDRAGNRLDGEFNTGASATIPLSNGTTGRSSLFPSGDGKPVALENADNDQFTQVLPDRPIVDLPLDHELFNIFYTIDRVLQVPNVGNGQRYAMGCVQCTSENDGYIPYVKGIFDDKGRLMVLINFNTDMGDAWEWAEDPYYPLEFSTYAFEMGVNMILYSMTH